MKIKLIKIFFLLVFGLFCFARFSSADVIVRKDLSLEPFEIENLRKRERQEAIEKDFFFSSSYDYGDVKISGREEKWTVARVRVAYLRDGMQRPYFEASRYSRRSEEDYTYDIGGYFKIDRAVLNLEMGAGQNVDYVYRFKLLGELTHPFRGNLYFKEKYKFLRNKNNNIHILSPGMIYYFGNHYILAYYNLSLTEDKGSGHWVNSKLNFNFFEKLDVWIGGALGERLYDVLEDAKAKEQEGFIVFSGVKLKIVEDTSIYVNFLFGEEDPKFIHRSIEGGLIIRF